ncbi:MAG: DEAD/DEAH box helicase [Proteobacteria bacterium]|nr:DEAD/DEAH box helicase [Pseudomonadota bacterium]
MIFENHTCKNCHKLKEENERLNSLLIAHGLVDPKVIKTKTLIEDTQTTPLTASEKIALFSRLFRGRMDVYPTRWDSTKGKSGYSPTCGNEWKPGICYKPRIKCNDCKHRLLMPINDQVIYDHLTGKHTIGIYPLLTDDTCYFLAVDFDETTWREDALAFLQSCREFEIPAYLEISRSGSGAHIWIFFVNAISAKDARCLGAALISKTCDRSRQLSLSSYDRLFPNQDTLPIGGFGNLIALPLQKAPREKNCSVFVNDEFFPWEDQWTFLSSVKMMSSIDVENAILKTTAANCPIDVAFGSDDDKSEPWALHTSDLKKITEPLPESINLIFANQIFINKAALPQSLANRLIRLAAFQNPEFYKAQAMRLPVWNKPRVIGCAENHLQHISLPRGCITPLLSLLSDHNIKVTIQDERTIGTKICVKFKGKLRSDQNTAFKKMLQQDIGILSATTAFGKTVVAAAIIARRKVNTLILVHRVELLRQWQERLSTFLECEENTFGIIGSGKKQITKKIDIAIMQSLSHQENIEELLSHYGQIIVDECHHLSAFSFESILKQVRAKYVVGLTATPIRRDGHHPIIFMQCGPICHIVKKSENALEQMEVIQLNLITPAICNNTKIQEIFQIITNDVDRNQRIAEDIIVAFNEGRKILVLSARTEQLLLLHEILRNKVESCFLLHGKLGKKQRAAVLAELEQLNPSLPRVILATGHLIGEGFDHPPLDTLVLAMPVSWKGTLQQYAGRLHRAHDDKRNIRIYDYVDQNIPPLTRMWKKRQLGYHAMGYVIQGK